MPLVSARLWVVATPIGNPDDLSPRARNILSHVDYLLAEDTRRAQLLCKRCGIPERPMLSFYDQTEEDRIPVVLDRLREGCEIALISDAGTPLISDPGYRLVKACQTMKIPVSPVPGPSAPMAALSIAGIAPIPFTFLGFLPRDRSAIQKLFTSFAQIPGSLIFFERSDRLAASLACAYVSLGQRDVAICRELTKTHEEVLHLRLAPDLVLPSLLGEITVVLGPGRQQDKTAKDYVCALLKQGLAGQRQARSIVKEVQQQVSGWHGKELYDLLEALKKESYVDNDNEDSYGSKEKYNREHRQ